MSNNLPMITFITPTYNRADLIESALLSVINQRRDIPFEWEMIIVDDGSTDNTSDIVKKYIKKYPKNIRYFHQKNSGIPGVARNVGLDHMKKETDYVVFIDSDDELKPDLVSVCLKKIETLKKEGTNDRVLGFYYLCEDEYHTVVGNKKILGGKKEVYFDYVSFLKGDINVEMGMRLKSSIFLHSPKLRFSESVITESVMRSQMRQYMHKHGMKILLRDYIGRFYRLNHTGETRICKNVSPKRFRNNALGNEEVLKIIEADLQKFGFRKVYADYLFKIGINYFLSGEKTKGLKYIKKSLKKSFNVIVFGIYVLALVSKRLVLGIYKLYV